MALLKTSIETIPVGRTARNPSSVERDAEARRKKACISAELVQRGEGDRRASDGMDRGPVHRPGVVMSAGSVRRPECT